MVAPSWQCIKIGITNMATRTTKIVLAIVIALAGAMCLTWAGWQLSKSRTHQLFGEMVTRVATSDSVIALTFDDGPSPVYTDSVLRILADSNVHATFFVVGGALGRHGDLGRRIVAEGHELGNHSYSHSRMVFKTPGFVRREIAETDSLIRAAGQRDPISFRPPYGKRLVVLPWILSRAGRPVVLWDLEPDSDPEVARDPRRIVARVLNYVRPGSILLLHVEMPQREAGRAALPSLIGSLRAAGYRLVTLSELMRPSRSESARTTELGNDPAPTAGAATFPRVGIAVRDTALAWCAAFPSDSSAPAIVAGQKVAIVFGKPTGLPALRARIVAAREAPCHAEFAQPRWFDYTAYDLALDDAPAAGAEVDNVALAVASVAAWSRGPDGTSRADLDGDGTPEEARRCAADEGEHFTIWSIARDGARLRRAHEYYDWGALVDPTCKPGENGLDQ